MSWSLGIFYGACVCYDQLLSTEDSNVEVLLSTEDSNVEVLLFIAIYWR